MKFPVMITVIYKDRSETIKCSNQCELDGYIATMELGENVMEYSIFQHVTKKVRTTSFVEMEDLNEAKSE